MAGIVYMKSNSSVSLTGAEYTGLSIPSGAKTLYVQTGSATSDRVKYGLTTDTSASVYSPLINVSGTTMYIASGGTVTETETTGTSYHTATRESVYSTGSSATSTYTTTQYTYVYRTSAGYNFTGNDFRASGTYALRVTALAKSTSTGTVSKRATNITCPAYDYNTISNYTNIGTGITRTNGHWYSQVSSTFIDFLYSTSINTRGNGCTTFEAFKRQTEFSDYNHYSGTLFIFTVSNQRYVKTGGQTIAFTSYDSANVNYTRSSTYTSRTEYLTSGRTYTTNNIAA